jgi:NAD(P)-dependent dehydrogenase (short-subunit alcohol dehydrogenase family)
MTMNGIRKMLITGAGSGLGEGTAIGLAQNGHQVIATAQTWPQVTALRAKATKLGLSSLRIEKLDLLDSYEAKQACTWNFDVLVNNAGIGEGGPMAEIPLELVRRNFEINVFGIQVQTINPGAFLTGFNEAMAESAFRWLDDEIHFTKRTAFRETVSGLIGNAEGRLDPSDMITKMIELVPATEGKFRNVFPNFIEDRLKTHQTEMFKREI